MNAYISVKELIENNLTIFVCLCIALFIFLAVLVILIVHKIKKHKTEENPDVYLIKKTLEEQKNVKEEDEVVEVPVVKHEENKQVQEIKVEEKKAEEPVKEPKKPVSKPKEEPKTKKQNNTVKKEEPKAKKQVAEVKKEEPKQEEIKEEPKKRNVQGKYELFFDGEKYYFVLKASNGEKLITSEQYATKDSALNAIEVIKRTVVEGNVIVTKDKRGLYQFTLLAKNHRKLVMSANYATEKGAISASESFKRFAGISPVLEIKELAEKRREEIKIEVTNKKGGRIGIVPAKDDKFCYIVKASNGVVLLNSDYYRSYDLALNGLNTFKEAYKNGKFYVEKDKRDYYQFKLYSQSGRLIVAGESYPTKQNAISACLSLCSFVEEALPLE